METIKISQLEKELQEINPNVRIVPNPNRVGISNIMLNGQDLVVGLPNNELQTEHSAGYVYVFPNGMTGQFKTYNEAKEMAISFLNKLKDPQFEAEFFDKEYATPDTTQYK